MVAKLTEVAQWCYQQTVNNPGTALMQTVREFVRQYTTHPTNINTGYYYQYTRVKNWDVIMTDLWKCIPAVSDPTQRYPEVLCYDATDIMTMILAMLGVETRSLRIISGQPVSLGPQGQPLYLDHTMAECWTGTMWSAQDAFYNVEYIKPSGGQYDWASIDDLCLTEDLSAFTPKNKTQSGWINTGTETLRIQDFYSAVEHRDVGGPVVIPGNGSPCTYTNGKSVVVMNSNRCDFSRAFYNPNTGLNTPLRTLVTGYTRQSKPLVIEKAD